MKKAARLTAGVVASCGLMLGAPAAAHASSTSTAARTATMSPALSNDCSGGVEVHFVNGDHYCVTTNGEHFITLCGVDWVNTGSNWVALVYGNNQYQPGMPPWTTWYDYNVCIFRVDVNT